MKRITYYFFVWLVLLSLPAIAQVAPDTLLNSGPVPVPEPSQKALDYFHSGNVLWVLELILGLAFPALLLFSGVSARMRTLAQTLGKNWIVTISIYSVLFSAVMFVLELPMSYYDEYVRQHAYELSNQAFGKWAADTVINLVIGMIVGSLFLWIPYLLLRKSPRRWWLYVGVLTVPFLVLSLLVAPVWIEPLFNDFGPMKDKGLESKILSLADRAGIEGSRVFEVNKSVDTKKINAYVTGFMGTKRIVLWDNTIAKLNEQELLFVMAHEMGHYVLGHIWKLLIFIPLFSMVVLYLAYKASGWLINRFKGRFGFDQLSDIASLPLLILLMNLFGFLASPVFNWYSRVQEQEADQFGLEMTRDNHAAATAFVKLQMENLGIPRPGLLYTLWRADHPVLGDRIDYANQYKPWANGGPLRYQEYFR